MKYSRRDLEKLANHSVMLSMNTGDKLVDSVLSVLKDNPMNPEQIRRLTEMANTDMFLEKFKGTSGDDRFVDFDVADPVEIIKKFLGEDASPAFSSSKKLTVSVKSTPEGTHVMKSLKQDPGLDTEDSRFYEDVTPTKLDKLDLGDILSTDDLAGISETKVASAEDESHLLNPFDSHKVKELLLDKVAASNYACDDLASDLAKSFKGIYSKDKHAAFEKEALANFGNAALPALQAVRIKLGKDTFKGSVSNTVIKQASDRYVSDKSSFGMSKVSSYIENLKKYAEAKNTLNYIQGTLEKEANLGFGAALTALGLSKATSGILGKTTEGLGYELSTRTVPLAYRIQAVDETAKQLRSKLVDDSYDAVKGLFGEAKDKVKGMELVSKRKNAVAQMLKANPDLASSGKDNLLMAVNTIGKVAPELSTNVPFLTSHTRQMLYNSEGGIPALDAASIESMAKAERTFKNLNTPMSRS